MPVESCSLSLAVSILRSCCSSVSCGGVEDDDALGSGRSSSCSVAGKVEVTDRWKYGVLIVDVRFSGLLRRVLSMSSLVFTYLVA